MRLNRPPTIASSESSQFEVDEVTGRESEKPSGEIKAKPSQNTITIRLSTKYCVVSEGFLIATEISLPFAPTFVRLSNSLSYSNHAFFEFVFVFVFGSALKFTLKALHRPFENGLFAST
jgi:hypothetical protein